MEAGETDMKPDKEAEIELKANEDFTKIPPDGEMVEGAKSKVDNAGKDGPETPPGMCGLGRLCQAGAYPIYVLVLLLLAYLLNQLDRYMLAITTKPLAQDIHYGDIVCMVNSTYPPTHLHNVSCNATSQQSCTSVVSPSGDHHVCSWDYNGQGFAYQLLVGPIFIVIYTFAGIFLGLAADYYNRKVLLAVCLIFWSVMTTLTGAVQQYWQLVILRFGLGIGEAGCTPFAVSMLGDYFGEGLRATAIGVYNWGIYLGYSMSYALGNFITSANILGQGWRWAFYISGIPGILLGFVILITVKEPGRDQADRETENETGDNEEAQSLIEQQELTSVQRVGQACKHFIKPSLLLLCLAGSFRNAAGYVWAYNTQVYYGDLGQSRDQIGSYMSWIPIVGGLISQVAGGFISDRFVLRRGPNARIVICIISQLLAAPFAAGAIFLHPPLAYFSLIPCYIIGEMWVGITLAVVIELVPSTLRTTAVAIYLFIITNIGGNIPLLVPPLQQAFTNLGYTRINSLKGALLVLYPGEYILGAVLYLCTLIMLRRDIRKTQEKEEQRKEARGGQAGEEARGGQTGEEGRGGQTGEDANN